MSALDPVEEYLNAIPLFAFVEPKDRPELLRLLRPVELKPGQVLFRQGEVGNAMWVLGPGVEVSISGSTAGQTKPNVIAQAREGDTLGEMALIDGGVRSGTATVLKGGSAHQIQAIDFATLREGHSPAAFKILCKLCMELAAKLRATSDRVVPPTSGAPGAPPLSDGRRPTDAELDTFGPFENLSKLVKLALSQKLTVHDFTEVTPVFSEGDTADSAYFVVSGEVTVGRNGATLATLGPSALIGLIAVLDSGTRSASCLTSGPARLLRLSRPDFEVLFRAENRFAFHLIKLGSRQLVTHIRETNELVRVPKGVPRPVAVPAVDLEELLPEGEILPLELEMEVENEAPDWLVR